MAETDRHAHLGGDRLDPRGGVDRVPGEQAFARAWGDPEANEGLPGVDPDAQAERCSADRLELLGVLGDPKSRANRALGVVLVGRRHPEDPDDRIPDELLHHAAVGLDLRPSHRGVGREHLVDVFGIGRLRGGGEPDQVAEERGDDLALLGDRDGRDASSGVAHSMQNFAPSGFSCAQEGQVVTAGA